MRRRYYEILGVPPNATQAEIREAWLFSVKAFHPDKFSASSSRQRAVAEERTKAINEAYDALSNPTKRADYDRERGREAKAESPPRHSRPPPQQATPPPKSPPQQPQQTTAPPPPGFSSSFVAPEIGYGRFTTLPKVTQRKLFERQSDAIKPQLRIPLRIWVGWNYIWLVICGAYFLSIWTSSVFGNSTRAAVGPEDPFPYALAAACAGFFVGRNVSAISRWTLATLKANLIVTPLYIIKTDSDEVWFWPLTTLRNLNGTNHFYNGIYLSTKVTLNFDNRVEEVKFRNKDSYPQFVAAFNAFAEKARLAAAQGDLSYFVAENDFVGVTKAVAPTRPIVKHASIGIYAVCFIIAGIMSTIAYRVDVQRRMAYQPDPAKLVPVQAENSTSSLEASAQHSQSAEGSPVPQATGAITDSSDAQNSPTASVIQEDKGTFDPSTAVPQDEYLARRATPSPTASSTPMSANAGQPAERTAQSDANARWPLPTPSVNATATPNSVTYRVVGVAEGDFLNIRQGPGSNYLVLGRLAPNATGIRLINATERNGETVWQNISGNGCDGWVSAEHLAPEVPGPAGESSAQTVPISTIYWQGDTYSVFPDQVPAIRVKMSEADLNDKAITGLEAMLQQGEANLPVETTLSEKRRIRENITSTTAELRRLKAHRGELNRQIQQMLLAHTQ